LGFFSEIKRYIPESIKLATNLKRFLERHLGLSLQTLENVCGGSNRAVEKQRGAGSEILFLFQKKMC